MGQKRWLPRRTARLAKAGAPSFDVPFQRVVELRAPKPLRIGRFEGAPIFLHPEALVLVGLCCIPLLLNAPLQAPVFGLALLVSILVHEMGHIHVARRCGLPPIAIDLIAIGGVARFEDREHSALQRAAIAAAGPAANFTLALALGIPAAALAWFGIESDMLARLIAMNSALAIGNLLPAYPLDGGVICEALLTARLGWRKTQILVAGLGLVIAVVSYPVMLALAFSGMPVLMPMFLGLNWRQFQQARTAPIWWRGPTRKPYGWT